MVKTKDAMKSLAMMVVYGVPLIIVKLITSALEGVIDYGKRTNK